jgi:hypothetical protein
VIEPDVISTAVASERVAAHVDAYARRVYPAVLDQHPGGSVSSPLGVWLLLAACGSAAAGEERSALELALGCRAEEATVLLRAFLASPPSALKAAIAVWVRASDTTAPLADWARGLPPDVESGFMPSQQEADAWAEKHTLGLITSFPSSIDALTRVVLASALATKVSWPLPLDCVPASEHLEADSPWRGTVEHLLWDAQPGRFAMIADTRAAGLVAVHQAVAKEELTVISVSADPRIARDAVLEAAHEIAATVRGDQPAPARAGASAPARSLFELPLGTGHSWQIDEGEIRTQHAGQHVERIAGVSLPAWRRRSELNLLTSELFAAHPALEAIGRLLANATDDLVEALQVAVASFTRYGFEAAAVTSFARAASAFSVPAQSGIERTAILRFDHPYAALAFAGRPATPGVSTRAAWTGLPLFTAWVQEPIEADADPR